MVTVFETPLYIAASPAGGGLASRHGKAECDGNCSKGKFFILILRAFFPSLWPAQAVRTTRDKKIDLLLYRAAPVFEVKVRSEQNGMAAVLLKPGVAGVSCVITYSLPPSIL